MQYPNKNDLPLISVVITTFNRCKLLEKSLLSVINQTYKNLEIIIADNHSIDGTEELCKKYVQKDSRIKYFRHDKNIGMSANSTFSNLKTTGKYVHILCDDDWIDRDFIEICCREIEKHPDYSFICPTVLIENSEGKLLSKASLTNLESNKIENRIKNYIYAVKNHNSITTGLLRNDLIKSMLEDDGFVIKKRFGDDWILVIKLLIAGKCKMINSTHYHKLDSGSTSNLKSMADLWEDPDLTYENIYENVLKSIQDALKNDNFCKKRLSKNESEYYCKIAQRSMLNTYKTANVKNVLNFIKNYFIIGYGN